jgi:hypothetical protein
MVTRKVLGYSMRTISGIYDCPEAGIDAPLIILASSAHKKSKKSNFSANFRRKLMFDCSFRTVILNCLCDLIVVGGFA